MSILASIYFIFFLAFTWFNFRLAVGFFILSLPTYLVRLNFGPLPSTLLELTFGAIFLVWLIKYARTDWSQIKIFFRTHGVLLLLLILFFIASVVGIFTSDMVLKSAGQWRAYFLEPMLLFVVLMARKPKRADLIWFLVLSTISISITAILQKFFPQLYPSNLGPDNFGGRVTAFFTSPNSIGLYLGPIMMLMVGQIAKDLKIMRWALRGGLIIAFSLSLVAIALSFSQGAWIALVAGLTLFVYLVGYKKSALVAVLVAVVVAVAIPQVRTAVLFQDQAGQNRLTLWRYSYEYLTASPKNFIFGTGIRQFFRKVQKPHYDVKELERLIYPHNIFLNFWTETGLLGVLSFGGLLIYLLNYVWKKYRNDKILRASLLSALVVLLVHGLVDVPYFKNDLAFLFWILFAIVTV